MKSVLVVGDVIVDKYIHCDATRLSPEAPVPVLEKKKVEFIHGGAANVKKNIEGLGGKAILIGAIGPDYPAQLVSNGENLTDYLFTDDRPTTTKTRILANGKQICRIDEESTKSVSQEVEQIIISCINRFIMGSDVVGAVVLSDYAKGTLTDKICAHTIQVANRLQIPVIVDPKFRPWDLYAGATIITPNKAEWDKRIDPNRIADNMKVLIKMGEEGMILREGIDGPNGVISRIPTVAKNVIDVTGAGDTVVAAISYGITARPDEPIDSIAFFANKAAAVAVSKLGTVAVTMREIEEQDL